MNTDTRIGAEPRLRLLRDALESGTLLRVQKMLLSLHPSEIADLLDSLPPPEREVVWDLVEPGDEGDILLELNDEVRAKLIEGMEAEALVAVARDVLGVLRAGIGSGGAFRQMEGDPPADVHW